MTRPVVVLNVNDDAPTRYLLSSILKRGGYTVEEASNGLEAVARARATRPDLVLLDVKLPDVNGLEVCRRLKTDPATSSLLVVLTSATFSSTTRKVEGLESGADAYLTQPVEAVELLATVRALLRTRAAEEGQRRLARKLQRTFDAIQDPVVLVDDAGLVAETNAAASERLGLMPSEALGRPVAAVLAPLLSAERVAALVEGARARRMEVEAEAPDGRHVRVSADPVPSDAGGSDGVVLIVSDVTERRLLERQLRDHAAELAEASRRKDEFLGMLAHELRNPLHAIGTAASVLEQTPSASDELLRVCGIIHRRTRGLARLVDDLLEVSRMTRGLLQLRTGPVDLVRVVREAAGGVRPTLEAKGQSLALALPDAPVPIQGDELRLEQIVSNLLTNASKFSPRGASVRLALEVVGVDGGRRAELRVVDDGVGIEPAMIRAIFEPFVQADQTLARSLGGLGIGLSMVKSLVELHGGSVTASSDGAGTGSTFVVRVPLVDAAPEAVARASREDAPSSMRPASDGERLRVLVVEDNPDTLELMTAWLASLGHEPHGAPDGPAGLALAHATSPDVALLDVGLPGMSGYELAEHLRASPDLDACVLVAVTGYGRPEDRARALDAGFDAHVVKPLDAQVLKRLLAADALARIRAERRGSAPAPRAAEGVSGARGTV